MNCDDFLPLLASGGWFGRWRARRHASRCSRCAAAASLLRELKADRSETPVPANLRQMWLAAARKERRSIAAAPVRSPAHLRLLGFAAAPCAIACVMLLFVAIAQWKAKPAAPLAANPPAAGGGRPTTKASPQAPDVGAIAVVEIDPAQQLAWLDERVVRLASDVEKLAKASHKRDVERRIEKLLALHPDW